MSTRPLLLSDNRLVYCYYALLGKVLRPAPACTSVYCHSAWWISKLFVCLNHHACALHAGTGCSYARSHPDLVESSCHLTPIEARLQSCLAASPSPSCTALPEEKLDTIIPGSASSSTPALSEAGDFAVVKSSVSNTEQTPTAAAHQCNMAAFICQCICRLLIL